MIATGPGRFSAWSVVGEVIDSGMRLLRCTAPGAIRLDDMAAGLLDARFEIHRDGSRRFLRGERDVFEVKRNLLGKISEFVGRGREMSMLTNLFSSAASESIASAVLVTGPAGAGKSRLRQELIEWVQRREQRAEVLFGAGDSLGAGSPFGMLGRAVQRAAGIQPGEALEEKRRKLTVRVARHVDSESVGRVAAFLGEMAGIPFADEDNGALQAARQNPQLMGDGMRRAWEDWLAAECAAGPVLIVLEDLHWGDLGHGQLHRRRAPQLSRAAADGARAGAARRAHAVPAAVAGARAADHPAGAAARGARPRSWCAGRCAATSATRSSSRSSSAPTATRSTWRS